MAIGRFTGRVDRLFPYEDRTNIRLGGVPEAEQPQDNYFRLQQTHPNYNALYSLALAAAINGYQLQIRVRGDDYTPGQLADVLYMVVDW